MATLHVNIVSAEQSIFSGDAEMVVVPGESGELGILPLHTPLLTRIRPGTVKVKLAGGNEELVFVSGGILEVQPKALTILANTSIRAKDLDEAKVMQAKQAAEEALANRQSGQERAVVQAELSQLAAQLAAIRKLRK
ncbi:MAG: F0F1 ATP synthase subunit epsilon [Rhodocyclaceae bacterium]|jgi:F-type H+-transporting ATPase subunit epsilon|nr:F0F1 ATP synthase subunit epsilon [Rhodocyclaceae bacterium]MCE2724844.1 F0F1 ATP synthase subunit epsilon [Betaproteobacteria bacterium]MCA3001857.1 F0F1 ATP synthase subunit epsilon [Rhodocyclaceae bacterium]MCA3017065.1 F0F1 ATP synthase subunit epsilon [Rhodocyclaceae bacterium]MCA3021875.1 F0F1 ATP synthase subunit epsilon [Rhodocyclaceae bacterium]